MSADRKIQFTTSAFWGNPEQAFYVGGEVNKQLPQESHLGLEVYSFVHRLPVSESMAARLPFLSNLVKDGYGFAFRDGTVDSAKLKQWQSEYGVEVDRVHAAFHASILNALYNYGRSFVVEQGTLKDRVIATVIAYQTMTAMNGVATKLAEDLDAGMNLHRNIVQWGERRGKLDKIIGNSRYAFMENDLDYPRKHLEDIRAERDVQTALDVIRRNNLGGLIYGVDHAYRAKIDPREDFEKFKTDFAQDLRVLHISGSKGDHGLIEPDDFEFWDFVKFAAARIPEDVIFCMDLDPLAMDQKKPHEQVEYLSSTASQLRNI